MIETSTEGSFPTDSPVWLLELLEIGGCSSIERMLGVKPSGVSQRNATLTHRVMTDAFRPMTLDEQAFLRSVGDRIRERRIALGLTQAQLGERCHLHRTFIGSVERGERNIAILNLRIIAQHLRIPLASLLLDPSEK